MNEVKEYFQKKAIKYDDVDKQLYWVLSDVLLWDIFDKKVLSKFKNEPFTFLDAGAGTGRWTIKILEEYPNSKGIMIDLSADMLNVAKEKLNILNYTDRVKIINGDLDTIKINEEEVDISFSFHNVLGFVEDAEKVIAKMTKAAKIGGYIVCGVPNYYHNIYFNISTNQLELAVESFIFKKGKFTKDMPSMHMFTPSNLHTIFEKNNIKDSIVLGFPVLIYPGYSETQIEGQTNKIKDILQNEVNFEKIIKIEKKLIYEEECASRGNQIVVIGQKGS